MYYSLHGVCQEAPSFRNGASINGMERNLAILQDLPISDPSRVTFDDYLRANHFTEQSYFSDPRVIQLYRDTLTMAAAEQHIVAGLPSGESSQAGISAYEQHLWQTGNVQVFLPARLGW
jgi:hypothetical protein